MWGKQREEKTEETRKEGEKPINELQEIYKPVEFIILMSLRKEMTLEIITVLQFV